MTDPIPTYNPAADTPLGDTPPMLPAQPGNSASNLFAPGCPTRLSRSARPVQSEFVAVAQRRSSRDSNS